MAAPPKIEKDVEKQQAEDSQVIAESVSTISDSIKNNVFFKKIQNAVKEGTQKLGEKIGAKTEEVLETTQKSLVSILERPFMLLTEPLKEITGFNPFDILRDLKIKPKMNPTKKDLSQTEAGQAALYQESRKEKIAKDEKGGIFGFLKKIGLPFLLPLLATGGIIFLARILPKEFLGVTKFFGKFIQDIKRLPKMIGGFIDIFKGIRKVFKVLKAGKGIKGIFKLFKSGFAKSIKGIFKGGVKGLKMVPILGAFVNAYFAYERFKKGDIFGGILEIVSGIADFVPGIGTVISIGIDAFLMLRDLMGTKTGKRITKKITTGAINLGKMLWSKMKAGITNILNIGKAIGMGIVNVFKGKGKYAAKGALTGLAIAFIPGAIIGGIWGGVVDGIVGLVNLFKKSRETGIPFRTLLKDKVKEVVLAIKDKVFGFLDKITGGKFSEAMEKLKDLDPFGKIKDFINDLKDKVFGFFTLIGDFFGFLGQGIKSPFKFIEMIGKGQFGTGFQLFREAKDIEREGITADSFGQLNSLLEKAETEKVDLSQKMLEEMIKFNKREFKSEYNTFVTKQRSLDSYNENKKRNQ